MFWRNKTSPTLRLHALLAAPPGGRPGKAVGLLKQFLRTHTSLDVNDSILIPPRPGQPPTPPVAPLTLALGTQWPAATQLQIVRMLLDAGAAPRWGTPFIKSHYAMAVEQGNNDVAELLVLKAVDLAGADDSAYGDILAAVFRTALSTSIPYGDTSEIKQEGEEQPCNKDDAMEVDGESGGREECLSYEENEDGIWPPPMLAAAWLIDRCSTDGRAARLQPGGSRSIVHSILAAFAERVEEEARQKQRGIAALASLPVDQRPAEEAALRRRRSVAVSCILHRLWALLQLAKSAGSPVVAVSVDHFPSAPADALCDLDLVWSGVKNFATAWMTHWERDSHSLYHPRFKEAAKEFILATMARGVEARGSGGRKETFFLDNCLVEKIIGHMAEDQAAWVPTLT